MHCRTFCIIPGYYPLGANSNPYPPGCNNQKCLQCLMPPGGRHQPQWRSACLDDTAWLSVCLYELEREGGYFEFCACHRYGCMKLGISKVRDYFLIMSSHLTLVLRELLWTPQDWLKNFEFLGGKNKIIKALRSNICSTQVHLMSRLSLTEPYAFSTFCMC